MSNLVMRSVSVLVVLLASCSTASGLNSPTLVPSQRHPLSLHLSSHSNPQRRSLTNGSGISLVGITNDKQYAQLTSGFDSIDDLLDCRAYYAVIQAGEYNFRVALDTGSSDLWLMSTDCASPNCKTVPRYPLRFNSSTFSTVNDNKTIFSTHFADGTGATGFVARDSINFANLTVANQTFGVVNSTNVTMENYVSGILGLGFPRLSSISNTVVNATPFFANFAQQGLVDYPLFGLSISRNNGTLTLGAYDSSVVTNVSNVVWNPVVPFRPFNGMGNSSANVSSYLQWAIQLSHFAVNGSTYTPIPTYPNATSNSSIALIDIGSPGIYGPYQDVSRLFSQFGGSRLVDPAGIWGIPCGTSKTMSFTFGGFNFTLQPSDYLIGPTAADPTYCLSWPFATSPSSDGIDWQMGTAFLRTVYSVFSFGINDKEAPMIGLYPLYATNITVESAANITSYLSTASETIATTLPGYVVPTPTYSTLSYTFNTSFHTPTSGIVSTGLATSSYIALLGTKHPNITALPALPGLPTMATLVLTDVSGIAHTSTFIIASQSITLGPPGWNAAVSTRSSCILAHLIPIVTTLVLRSNLLL